MKRLIFFVCFIVFLLDMNAMAGLKPRPLATDSRMRVVAYDRDNVVNIIGSQLVETNIEFGDDETIVGVNGGDSAAWTVFVNKVKPNILTIKPTVDSSDTNLSVITDANVYQFHLIANPKETASDKDVTYNVRFVYPDKQRQMLVAQFQAKQQFKNSIVTQNAIDPMNLNWNYSFSTKCTKSFVPLRAFDDGKFTYFQFSNNAEIPAIFVVDQEGKESLANWQMRGQYVVIQRLARQFSMRNGKGVSCIFNDSYIS